MRDSFSLNPSNPKQRILGIDLIRFFSFYAILAFHQSYALWAGDGHEGLAVKTLWLLPIEVYARTLAFSGFSVMFLSFFLFGLQLRASRKWHALWPILFVFFIIWSVL